MKRFRSGDRVSWRSAGMQMHGQIKRIITDDIKVVRRVVRATEDNPAYLVKTNFGNMAFCRAERLRKY